MKIIKLISIGLLMFAFSCSQPEKTLGKKVLNETMSNLDKDPLTEMTTPHQNRIENYTIKYGYLKYDEEKYGFDNPGFMKVYIDNKLFYTDSFRGEGQATVESLGHHDLDGDKIIFRLNYGTEACDYAYTSKYYFADKNNIKFLKECYSITGGDQYSSKFYEHIFPTDSAGLFNTILIVEGQIFHEKDQPDRFDTSYIKFWNGKFEISKPTDNLSKVK